MDAKRCPLNILLQISFPASSAMQARHEQTRFPSWYNMKKNEIEDQNKGAVVRLSQSPGKFKPEINMPKTRLISHQSSVND